MNVELNERCWYLSYSFALSLNRFMAYSFFFIFNKYCEIWNSVSY